MKLHAVIIFLFIFNISTADAKDNIAFIDLNYIMKNSSAGKLINNFINEKKKKKIDEFKAIEKKIKIDEDELISKKNIIEIKVYNSRVDEIKKRISKYKLDRENFNNSLEEDKIKYTNKLLEILNPIISDYVEKNSISIVLPKKMIIVGKKKLDITLPVLKILNKSSQKFNLNE